MIQRGLACTLALTGVLLAQPAARTVEAPAGKFLQIIAHKKGSDAIVTIADPSGKVILTADTPGDPNGDLTVSLITAIAGRYSVRVTPPRGAELEIAAPRDPADADRARIAAEGNLFAAAARDRSGNKEGRAEAIKLYLEAAPLGIEEAYCYRRAGELSSQAGDHPKAIEHLTKSLAIEKSAVILNALGLAYSRLGDHHKSIETYQQALELQRSNGDRAGQAATLSNIAYAYVVLGEQQKWLDALLEVVAIRRELKDRPGEVLALTNLAIAYYTMSEPQKALDTYEQVLALRRALGDRAGEAQTLSALASAYRDMGGEQKALELFEESLRVAHAAGDHTSEADTYIGMGDVYFFLGEKKKSLDAYQKGADQKRAANDKSGEALALIGIGNVYSDLASRQKAADSEGSAGKKKALDYYEKSLAIGRANGDFFVQVFALMGAGVAYSAEGDKKKAMDYLNQALFFFGTARFQPGEGWARYEMARVERDRGNLDKALELARRARDVIESLRSKVVSADLRASFFAAVHDCYRLEVDVLMAMNRPADALTASERARARVLLETLGESHADIREGVDQALLDREQQLAAQLNAKETARIQLLGARQTPAVAKQMSDEIRTLAAKYEEARNRIRAGSPRYAALKFPEPLTLDQIQSEVLDQDTLLLEYALGEQRSFLWVVSREKQESFVLPKRTEIEAATKKLHDAWVEPTAAITPDAAKSLSKVLLGDAAPLLANKRLLIVADGLLQYLPFAALPDPNGFAQPLVVNHEIVNVPSASTVAVLRRENRDRRPAPKWVALLADPVFSMDDSRVAREVAATRGGTPVKRGTRAVAEDPALLGVRLPRLPGTRREAAAIAALVPEAERKQALDFDASRATLTSPEIAQYRILHLATHGLLNTTHPELSGVVLSLVDRGGKPQNGYLRLYEIFNLKLRADLVVLSACQTALGQDIQGEGLVGLTRGFMYAGAPRVLASLWKVDDRATSELMKRLYTAMLGADRLRPAAALRNAQIEMWKTKGFENPYYWAAFTLQGEWH